MTDNPLISLGSIAVLGIGAQWLAWRLRLPSILLLLLGGFLAGPLTGLVEPDDLLGETLFPVVSISVGIILFEGGLTLKLDEIRGSRKVIFLLISIGALITWIIATLAAYTLVGTGLRLSVLIGAIFIVTGPTVVLPLLRQVRPRGQVGAILKWEGILIDPVGATVAVLVFEAILAAEERNASVWLLLTGTGTTLLVGAVVGLIAALIMVQILERFWVPEYLQNPISVMFVVGAFVLADQIRPEAGLLATTVMGLYLANQHSVSVRHITQFKEDLGILLLSSLFILLAARLETETLSNLSVRGLGFLAVLMLVARPLTVFVSTLGSHFTWRERAFMAWLAPRGIVAVSVASLFALELSEQGYEGAEQIVPLTFLVVVGTVVVYGLSASWVARRLGLRQPDASGILIVGAHDWAQEIARALLQSNGGEVLLVDSNWDKVSAAKLSGLPVVYASVLSDAAVNEIDLSRIGRLLAMTSNDEVNSLAALRFTDMFGRANVYQLPLHNGTKRRQDVSLERHLVGRSLFGGNFTYDALQRHFDQGAVVKTVKLTRAFGYDAFRRMYGSNAVPLFLIDESGKIVILTAEATATPRAGQMLIALVEPAPEPGQPVATLDPVTSATAPKRV